MRLNCLEKVQMYKLEENLKEFKGNPIERTDNTSGSFQIPIPSLFPLRLLDEITADLSTWFCHTAPYRSTGILINFDFYNDGFEGLVKKCAKQICIFFLEWLNWIKFELCFIFNRV